MQLEFGIVLGVLAVAAVTTVGARLRIAGPLLLVVLGGAASLVPGMPAVTVPPEVLLTAVLPPLLYASAAAMPAMDFRREFRPVSGFAVVLVVATSVALGLFFAVVLPGIGFGWGLALGAILSPTDAVATTIVKRLGAPERVVAVLEGEGLLNDASALVLLRAAVVGAGATLSVWGVVGDFALAVAIAAVVGFVVAHVVVMVRARISDAYVSSLVSFTTPFLASLPAEAAGASGLVAAVVAGLVTGHHSPRVLPPVHRVVDTQNWRTVEVLGEGALFLLMGLQLSRLLADVPDDRTATSTLVVACAGAWVITVAVRAAYTAPVLYLLHRQSRSVERMRPQMTDFQTRLDDPTAMGDRWERRPPSERRLDRIRTRVRRSLADIDHLLAHPLGFREGTVVVWAGMRGAVTVAAAQTLPESTPQRSVLVLIAFVVAATSLLVQGGLLPVVVLRVLRPDPARGTVDDEATVQERQALLDLLTRAADTVPAPPDDPEREQGGGKAYGLAVYEAQRTALLDARDDGLFSAAALASALDAVDVAQIGLEMRSGPATPAGADPPS
ncbi:cation:proton antiporter [Actinomycetospora endophytica]|uniref:Cation:proton antiporter n=1 Tax=Actinomycetospora endophytica TaxID=2291215 RepID=A0ABS8P9G3_9PSEU|nr:cation:proton antiporter [Actinomycetospora endophytica]MCD2194922.1 cation:proton antiporter [Actinomycetospora endophytica]